MLNNMSALGNASESVKDQNRKYYEQSLNAQKKIVANVLDEVMKYCK